MSKPKLIMECVPFLYTKEENQQPRPKGTRYVVLIRYLYEGFNTLLSALKGGVLNPQHE